MPRGSKAWPIRKRQTPIKGGRIGLGSTVLHAIRKHVEQEARAEGVSLSYVVAVRLALSYGIKEQERY